MSFKEALQAAFPDRQLFFTTGTKLQPSEETLARRIDIPEGGLAIPTLTNISMPSSIAGIGIGGIIIIGIIAFLVLRK